jgi:hypothetical protein
MAREIDANLRFSDSGGGPTQGRPELASLQLLPMLARQPPSIDGTAVRDPTVI